MTGAYLGIDCGTQSTKAILVDAVDGAPLALGRAAHDLVELDDGTREQRPEWWIDALVTAVRQALEAAPGVEIRGIGVSGQQHGLVALDNRDRPVRPAKLWNDTTTDAECVALTRALGGRAAVLALTGNVFLTGYTAPKIAWLRSREPDVYGRAVRFCLPHDFINLWLTGEFVTEPGDASGTAYFDVRARDYSELVLSAIDPDRDWERALPPIVASMSIVGRLRPAAADALGLSPGTPVSGGGGDNMCAAIGVGAVRPGPVVVSLGTSGTVFTHRPSPALDPLGEAAAFCDSTGGWLPLACTLNATGAIDWIRRLFDLDLAGFETAIQLGPVGADGLTFLPYLEGERTPDVPKAHGALHGLRVRHGPIPIVRAVVEGVTFGLAYALEALRRTGVEPTQISLVGGGAQSSGWGQLCADAFSLPVMRPEATEAAAIGAARQARQAVEMAEISELPGPPAPLEQWEPRKHPALDEARERAAAIRSAVVAGRL